MREQPCAGGNVGAELPVHILIHVSLPGAGAGSTIHKTASQKGRGTPQHWAMILPARWYRTPKLNTQQIQVWKAFLLLFLGLSKKR